MVMAMPTCLRLDTQRAVLPRSRALLRAGSNMAARIPMMAITTNNSINVKALRFLRNSLIYFVQLLCWRASGVVIVVSVPFCFILSSDSIGVALLLTHTTFPAPLTSTRALLPDQPIDRSRDDCANNQHNLRAMLPEQHRQTAQAGQHQGDAARFGNSNDLGIPETGNGRRIGVRARGDESVLENITRRDIEVNTELLPAHQ